MKQRTIMFLRFWITIARTVRISSRATEIEGDNFMTWMENEALLDCIGTAVHEQSHGYTSHNMSYNGTWVMAYYTGRGQAHKGSPNRNIPKRGMAAQIPEELRTFRYDTYVGKGAVVSANKRGIIRTL